jgi:hypothetical protein
MKINLKDYSLISNAELKFILGEQGYEDYKKSKLIIPSRLLANKCFNMGEGILREEKYSNMEYNEAKHHFLNGDIDI